MRNRIFIVLAVIAATAAIALEAITFYRQYIGLQTDMENLAKTKAETCAARATAAGRLVGRNAENIRVDLGDCSFGYDKQRYEQEYKRIFKTLREGAPTISDDEIDRHTKAAIAKNPHILN